MTVLLDSNVVLDVATVSRALRRSGTFETRELWSRWEE